MSNVAARTSVRIEIVKKLYTDFERGDIEAILAACTDDSCWIIPGSGAVPFAGTHMGKAAIGEFCCKLITLVEIEDLQAESFLQDANVVVAMGYLRGTARRTGKTFHSPWLHCWTFSDTHIAGFQDSYDTLAVARALQ
jgi:ketosteroid isomerase-like protein